MPTMEYGIIDMLKNVAVVKTKLSLNLNSHLTFSEKRTNSGNVLLMDLRRSIAGKIRDSSHDSSLLTITMSSGDKAVRSLVCKRRDY